MLATAALSVPGDAAAQGNSKEESKAGSPTTVTIALLPTGTTVQKIARRGPFAPGILSAGIGTVPAAQTYLDITQGNRLNRSLYSGDLPLILPLRNKVPDGIWRQITERAVDAPADIKPGLLAGSLKEGGLRSIVWGTVPKGSELIAASPGGDFERDDALGGSGLIVRSAYLAQLSRLAADLQGNDLLIALERFPIAAGHRLAVGIAGRGFRGNLTSDSTRTDGYVLSTDLAPTILKRLDLRVPDAVGGRPIHSEGEADPASIASFERRLVEVGPRRGPVIETNLLIWLGLTGLTMLFAPLPTRRWALRLLAVSAALVPAALLLTAAIEPSELVERLIVGVGVPLVSGLILAALAGRTAFPGYLAFAVAGALSVGGYAVDVVVGSPLTAVSLIGPNPGAGVRFYGIGNELEATLSAIVLLATGAGLAALAPRLGKGHQAAVFAIVGLLAVLAFAPGSFGADVGAAITIPAGVVGAVALLTGARSSRLILLLAAPVAALAALIGADLLVGGDAHLTRSVLDAGGLDELGQVFERRVRLSASTFEANLTSPFMIAVAGGLIGLVLARNELREWVSEAEPAGPSGGFGAISAGLFGAFAAAVVGTLANDSGSTLLMLAGAYVLFFTALVWAERNRDTEAPP